MSISQIKTSISGFIFGISVVYSGLPFLFSSLYGYDDRDRDRYQYSPSKGKQYRNEDQLQQQYSRINRLEYILILCLVLFAVSTLVLYLCQLDDEEEDRDRVKNVNKNDGPSSTVRTSAKAKIRVKLNPRSPSQYGFFGYDGNIIGGLIQGFGMGILKSEPGVVFVLVGWGFSLLGDNNDDNINNNNNTADTDNISRYIGSSSSSSSGTFNIISKSISNGVQRTAFYALIGGIIGGFCFVLFDNSNFIKNVKTRYKNSKQEGEKQKNENERTKQKSKNQILTLSQYLGIKPFQFVVGYEICLLLGVFLLLFVNGYIRGYPLISALESNVISPFLTAVDAVKGGIYIGLSQLTSIILTRGTLGVSSAYPTLATHILRWIGGWRGSDDKPSRFSKLPNPGVNSLFFASGVMLSGFSARAINLSNDLNIPKADFDLDVTPWRSIIGGILMIFGARLAGGCTSGHGISGFGLLSISSFITVVSMIGGVVLGCICV